MKYDLKTEANEAKEYLLKLIDKNCVVEITKKLKKRTVNQNSLYWLWLTCIEHETGNDKDDLHEFFKNKWIISENKEVLGEYINIKPSTTKLDTVKFKQYLDKIQIFASTELSISLPNPEDKAFEEFERYYRSRL